jgi:pyruvate kinase
VPHAEIVGILEEGDKILVDDGKLILTVTEAGKTPKVRAEVPGKLSDKKGFTVRGKPLPVRALTDKDRADLDFALEIGVDIVALSFVQSVSDVEEVKAIIAGRAPLVSKLEKPAAITNLEAIVEVSDAVMVARGDLGVEFAPEDVPVIQRRIVRVARSRGRPVIVATQMLESMIENAAPTRAEASDVATAIYQGADAVMLSAETAVGRHPATAVAIMARIIRATESAEDYRQSIAQFAGTRGSEAISCRRRRDNRSGDGLLPRGRGRLRSEPARLTGWPDFPACAARHRSCTVRWMTGGCGRRVCCGACIRSASTPARLTGIVT